MATNETVANPHIGFTTFQRFNGDGLNPAETRRWTEGYPIEYQPFSGSLANKDHPDTTVAYFRVYWRFFEPEDGAYNFAMIDKALETAAARGQTLMFRLAPYGLAPDQDVPDWYRAAVGPARSEPLVVDPNDPFYASRYGRAIGEIAARYDADQRLDSVDLSLVGPWGEGAGTEHMTMEAVAKITEAYTSGFRKTPLMGFPVSPDTVLYANRFRPVGFRADCLGDMGDWMHMINQYPRLFYPMRDLWKKSPVSFEVCWVMYHWLDKGWGLDYIVEQSLKWHISTFNAKSSPVPPQWQAGVGEWLKKMGYRYALRFFDYPASARAGDELHCCAWIENLGVAPLYHEYPAVLCLKNDKIAFELPTDIDLREYLPGDTIWNGRVRVPGGVPAGNYSLQFGIVDPRTRKPAIRMPIDAEKDEGFAVLGPLKIE